MQFCIPGDNNTLSVVNGLLTVINIYKFITKDGTVLKRGERVTFEIKINKFIRLATCHISCYFLYVVMA